jgi:chromate transport protein ChrA
MITQSPPARGSIGELTLYFLRLGLLGFGGPVALVGQMERELVAERGWLSNEQMHESIAICQSLPAIGDWLTVPIGVASLAILFRWKVSNPLLIAATAVAGLIAFPLLPPDQVMVK